MDQLNRGYAGILEVPDLASKNIFFKYVTVNTF